LVSFVARPGPAADVGQEGPAPGGAFVNVYVVAADGPAAERQAREGVEEAGWWIESGADEPERLDSDALEDEAVEMVAQARSDGAVWVFHTWPAAAEDDPGPVPG
jgi:hypothetical protein